MNKITIFLILGLLHSCSPNKKEMIGTWIQIKNYQNPEIFIIKEDSFMSSYNDFDPILYKSKNDTILFQSFSGIHKMKYNVKNDTLIFTSLKSDTLFNKYVKNDSCKVLDIWNHDLNMSVELPTLSSDKFNWDYDDNMILLDNNTSEFIFYNGTKLNLDENLYYHLIDTSEHWFSTIIYNNLFIDKDVKFKHVIKLLNELAKANSREVRYLTYDPTKKLNQFSLILPWIDFDYPDSIRDKHLIPPPPINIDRNYKKGLDLICEFKIDKVVVNNDDLSFDRFQNRLIRQLNTKKQPAIYVNFDENLSYEKYIDYLFNLKNIYKSLRDQYALEEFGTKDRYELEDDQMDEIRNTFPMYMYYVNSDWIYKNKNAL